MKKYFSKDWKFFWRQDSFIGNWYGVFMNRLGMVLLKAARKSLRIGGGTFMGKYYSNCSWCGTDSLGSYSSRGSRCLSSKPCDSQPFV